MERYFIVRFRQLGHRLLNQDEGGRGARAGKMRQKPRFTGKRKPAK
jgi:hypothetical protein